MIIPSILIVPGKYNNNKLISQIPVNESADFTVSRLTTATRVNSNGLINLVTNNVPRIDYLNQSCPALLVEPSGSNVLTWSEDFTQAVWEKDNSNVVQGSGSNAVVTANYDTAPNGTMTADRLQLNLNGGTTSGDRSGLFRSITGLVSGAQSASIYIKSNTVNSNIRLQVVGGTDVVKDITATSSWQRFDLIGNNNTGFRIFLIGGTTSNSADLSIWGAQLETGSVATTYISTTSGTGSRAADVISASGVSGLIGQTEGTMYWEGIIYRIDRVIFSLAQGTSVTNSIYLQTLSNGFFRADVFANNSSTCAIQSLATATLGQFYKIAFAYKENDFALYINGVLQGSDNLGALPSGLSNAIFARGDSSLITDQRCRAAALYTTRLSNNELQLLTKL